MNTIASVLDKDVVRLENVTEDMKIQDPVHVEYAWVSGGYMNLFIMFPTKLGSKTSHLINLVHEGNMIDSETGEEISGTYRFSLRHNSFDDKITSVQDMNFVLAGGYVSFPLNRFIVEEEAQFAIEWIWHTRLGDTLTIETETKSFTAKYSSEGFQHAQQGTSTKSADIR